MMKPTRILLMGMKYHGSMITLFFLLTDLCMIGHLEVAITRAAPKVIFRAGIWTCLIFVARCMKTAVCSDAE